jgi:hypothetical protein
MAEGERVKGRWAVAVACSVATSCGLFVDTNGLSGGATPTPAPPGQDGGADTAEASTDTPEADGADAADSSDSASGGPSGPFCSSAKATGFPFCEDFDGATLLPGRFTEGPSEKNGGKASLDTSVFRSPPGSFEAWIPQTTCATATVTTRFDGAYTALKGSFDLRIDAIGTGTGSVYNESFFTVWRGTTRGEAIAYLDASSGHLALSDVGDEHATSLVLTIGTWQTLSFDIDISAGTAQLALDGQPAAVSFPGVPGTGPLYLQLGFDCDPNPAVATIHFDDVLAAPR